MTKPILSTVKSARKWVLGARRGLVFAAGLALLGGCGGEKPPGVTVHLAGTIRIGGKPIPAGCEATVRFMPTQPGQALPSNVEIKDSKFDAPLVPKGPLTLVFNITRLTGKMVVEDNAPGGTPYPEREDLVPPQHRQGVPYQAEQDNLAVELDLR